MDVGKRKKLESAGWKVGDIDEFLGLSVEEMEIINQMADSDRNDEEPISDS